MQKLSISVLALVAMITLFTVGCQKQNHIINNRNAILVEISFIDNVKATDEMWQHIIDVASGNVQQLEFTMLDRQGNPLNVGGGKTFEDNQKINIAQIKKELLPEMTSENLLSEKNAIESGIIDSKSLESIAQQRENLNKYTSQYTDIRFTKLTALISESAYKELSSMSDISIDTIDRFAQRFISVKHTRDSYNWTPDVGKVVTEKYNSTKRQVYSEFKWLNRPFSAFGYTYEHDFFLNNYSTSSLGAGTYLSRSTNSTGFPICTWATNMPNAYLDTRLFDENSFQGTSNEVPYTVGCGEGYNLAKNTVYWTQILTNNGDATTDNGKLTAQAGTQVPVGSTSVWASFSYQQISLIGAWNIPVPGTTSWTYGLS